MMDDQAEQTAVARDAAEQPAEQPVERRVTPEDDRAAVRRDNARGGSEGPAPVMSPEDTARLNELRAKRANPNVLPPDVRTEDEEMEYRRLAKSEADAARVAARVTTADVRPSPQDRVAELKAMGDLAEGQVIDLRRAEELVAAEARVAELKKKAPPLSDDEYAELAQKQRFVHDARVAGGYDEVG